MEIIDGRKIAEEIKKDLAYKDELDNTIVDIFFKGDPATEKFVERKKKFASEIRVNFRELILDKSISTDELIEEISKVAEDPSIGAIVLQLPLPEGIDKREAILAIPKEKDVDDLRGVYDGEELVFAPAVETFKEIIRRQNIDISKLKIVVLGAKGFLVGEPIARYLKDRVRDLILIDKDDDLSLIKEADIIISGVGKAGLFKASELKNGAGVIDFGTSLNGDNKISGDMLLDKTDHLKFYTPTPGGTGPILVAKLFDNFYKLARE